MVNNIGNCYANSSGSLIVVSYKAYADPNNWCHLSIACHSLPPYQRSNPSCSSGATGCRSNPPSTFVQGAILEGHRVFITHLVATSSALRRF